MLVGEVISRVRSMAGDINALQFTDAQLIEWINDGIRECAVVNNLFQKRGTNSTAVGVSEYPLPEDILKIHSVTIGPRKIVVLTLEEFEARRYDPDDEGDPNACYIWAGNLILQPKPNKVEPLVINYLYHPPAHTDDSGPTGLGAELRPPVGYHSRIVDYCLAQVALQDEDMNRYSIKMQEFKTGVQDLKDQPENTYDLYPSISIAGRDTDYDFLGWDY